MSSIALCCNIYQDVHALRGLLESGQRFFDNLFFLHSGPGGKHSTDGTIELLEKFGVTIRYDDANNGFGHLRSRLIHECGCEWAFILDADERFHPQLPVMRCEGDEQWSPGKPMPNLTVTHTNDIINQAAHVRNLMTNADTMAIRSTRRHWFDFTMKHPSQNWEKIQDHQLRIVRNRGEIGYVKERRMHEHLIDSRTGQTPQFASQDPLGGPHHDHYHVFFRHAYPGTKEWNEQQYAKLERGENMDVR